MVVLGGWAFLMSEVPLSKSGVGQGGMIAGVLEVPQDKDLISFTTSTKITTRITILAYVAYLVISDSG